MDQLHGNEFWLLVVGRCPAAEEMEVEMVHRLSPETSDVERKFISGEVFCCGDALRGVDDRRDDVTVVGLQVCDGLNVLFRDDDDMDRGLGMDIGKRQDPFVLGDNGCRDRSPDNAAKYTVHG